MKEYCRKKTVISGPSLGTSSIVFIVLIVLKLCKVISLSWFWVTFPLWCGIAFVLLAGLSWLAIYYIKKIFGPGDIQIADKNYKSKK